MSSPQNPNEQSKSPGNCCCANKQQLPVKEPQNLHGTDLPLHTLVVSGASCGGCVRKIEKALKSVAGVEDAQMNISTAVATVSGRAESSALIRALEGVGFSAVVSQ